MVGLELMAMVELFGASTFVMMYGAMFKAWFEPILKKYRNFERYSVLFIPTYAHLKKMPSLIFHVLPERTIVLGYISLILVGLITLYMQTLIVF